MSCLAVLTETHAEEASARFQSQTVGEPDEREPLQELPLLL
jgi:hypothetical protein